jgi:hypothetical protein
MRSSQANKTTVDNLEEKFDRGEDVLDYFNLSKTRVVHPQSKNAAGKKSAWAVKKNPPRRAMIREKSARYQKKK